MSRQELKAKAKEQIKGNIGILFVMSLIVSVVASIANIIPVIGPIVVISAFTIATIIIYLKLAAGINPEIAELFQHFGKFWAAFKVMFLTGLFTMLWSLLLYIPGIIKGLSYSMSMYILAENPDMPALEAIDRSKKMMDGHKMEFFILVLSFIGWSILASIPFNLGNLLLNPYRNAAEAAFYRELKRNQAVL